MIMAMQHHKYIMYTLEILCTSASLLLHSILLLRLKERRVQSMVLSVTSLVAIVVSFIDLSSRDEPLSQRLVYQIMHGLFALYGYFHIDYPKEAIVMLGCILIAASIMMEHQASNYVREFVWITGFTALITKDDHEVARILGVAATTLFLNRSKEPLPYALIVLAMYPVMSMIKKVDT